MPAIFSANNLPTRADLYHDESTVVTGNALAVTIDTGQIDNYFARQSASANGDSFTQSVFLRAGTYTFSVEGQTNAANGMIDWYLDGSTFTTGQDWYSAAQTKNVVKTVSSVVIANDGYHVLKGVVNGKNASSTGFNMDLTKMWFRQAAD
jgi:hypothetical protein